MRTNWLLLAAALAFSCARVAFAFDPAAGDFSRDNPDYVRLLTWNCLQNFPDGTAAEDAAFGRILTAIGPDAIVFQEIDSGTAFQDIQARLNALLGGSWSVWLGESDGFTRNALCSRWPQSLRRMDVEPASEVRGVTCALVDLPDARFDADLYLMGVHFKCCGGAENDARRQVHADALAKWFGDLRSPGGVETLAPDTPSVALGDFNLNNGFSEQPGATILTGNIQDNAAFGPDIAGDWDGSGLAEALPGDPFDLDFDTWPSGSGSPTGRLDRFYYTDSAATVAQAFTLNTASMPGNALSAAGLLAGDSETASDHLPAVADFAIAPVVPTEPLFRDKLFVTEFIADPNGSDAEREWFEVFNPGASPVDLDGWIVRDQGSNFHRIDAGGPLLVAPKGYAVLGRDHANDGVPLDYAYGSDISLNNSGADTLELYRGAVKVDGIRFNGGDSGQGPANVDWGGALVGGRSRGMAGNYQDGPSDVFQEGASAYGTAGNRGTPGGLNDGAQAPAESGFAGVIAR